MTVRVRATRDFTTYHGPTCQVLSYAKGTEVEGDLAVYLATTGTPVQVLDDPDEAVTAVLAGAEAAAEAGREPATPIEGPPAAEYGDTAPVPAADYGDEVLTPGDDAEAEDSATADDQAAGETEGQPAGGEDPDGEAADDDSTAPPANLAEDFDPAEHNVKDVLARAKARPEEVPALLAQERAGKARTTLLAELSELTAAQA